MDSDSYFVISAVVWMTVLTLAYLYLWSMFNRKMNHTSKDRVAEQKNEVPKEVPVCVEVRKEEVPIPTKAKAKALPTAPKPLLSSVPPPPPPKGYEYCCREEAEEDPDSTTGERLGFMYDHAEPEQGWIKDYWYGDGFGTYEYVFLRKKTKKNAEKKPEKKEDNFQYTFQSDQPSPPEGLKFCTKNVAKVRGNLFLALIKKKDETWWEQGYANGKDPDYQYLWLRSSKTRSKRTPK